MPQSFGSRDHPVDLGPFSRIVEVGWRRLDYLAYQSTVQSDNPQGPSATCFPDTGFPDPNPGYYSGCIDKTRYYLGLTSPGFTGSCLGYKNNSEWVSVNNVTFADIPATPDAGNGTLFDHAVDVWQFPNQAAFVDAGAALEIPVPGHPSMFFKDALSIQAVSKARAQNEGAVCVDGMTWFPESPGTPGNIEHSEMHLSLAGMTASYRGDTFHFFGLATIQNTVPPFNYVDPFPVGTVYFLFKREVPTS
jgi:hypothetical protein